MNQRPNKIVVIGGGVIGLSIGWQLLRSGTEVTLLERNKVGSEASYAAAGMLAPYAEVGFEEVDLMRLGQYSLGLYPKFLRQLAEDVDEVPALDRCGTLLVGIDRDDTEHLRRLYDFREQLELPVELMTGSEAREHEPHLSPNVVSSVWLPKDAQVDNRKLLQALHDAFLARGGELVENYEVDEIKKGTHDFEVEGTNGKTVTSDAVVVAAGSWSGKVNGMPKQYGSLLRPVKGQILTLRQTRDCQLSCIVRSPRTYLVPKEDGSIRLGATSEEKGYDKEITAGGLKYLLEYGWEVVPSIYDLPVEESIAGLRPAAKDNAPVVGSTKVSGLFVAGGHYRHGILLTPATAFGMAQMIMGDEVPDIWKKFSPGRFNEI